MKPAMAKPIAGRRMAIKAIVARGSPTVAAASIRRVDGVLANASPLRRLLIAVAKISAPGETRSNGVANVSPRPVAVTPTTTTWPRTDFGSKPPLRTSAALMRLKVPEGP